MALPIDSTQTIVSFSAFCWASFTGLELEIYSSQLMAGELHHRNDCIRSRDDGMNSGVTDWLRSLDKLRKRPHTTFWIYERIYYY